MCYASVKVCEANTIVSNLKVFKANMTRKSVQVCEANMICLKCRHFNLQPTDDNEGNIREALFIFPFANESHHTENLDTPITSRHLHANVI